MFIKIETKTRSHCCQSRQFQAKTTTIFNSGDEALFSFVIFWYIHTGFFCELSTSTFTLYAKIDQEAEPRGSIHFKCDGSKDFQYTH